MSASKVLFVIGAGPNAGLAVARRFHQAGYKVALASRSATPGVTDEGFLRLAVDASQPDSIAPAFDAVTKHFSTAPSVVVYNAAAASRADDPLAHSIEQMRASLNINILSVYAAAQAALRANPSVTFIYTGNYLNHHGHPLPRVVDLGMGKSASASLIETLAAAYKDKQSSWYYADERTEEGGARFQGIDGESTAKHYLELAERGGATWLQTFTKAKGYVPFEEPLIRHA